MDIHSILRDMSIDMGRTLAHVRVLRMSVSVKSEKQSPATGEELRPTRSNAYRIARRGMNTPNPTQR